MRRKGKISEEDRALWDHVRQSIKPMHNNITHKNTHPLLNKPVKGHNADKAQHIAPSPMPRLPRFSQFPPNATTRIDLKKPLPNASIDGLQRSTRRAIAKGRIEPTARIDLHGDRLATAHQRFLRFIRDCATEGHRVVLVITGKGGHHRSTDFGTEVSGIIRRSFPEWMQDREIAALVSHYCPSHIKHGGDGAFYVFIRTRARN